METPADSPELVGREVSLVNKAEAISLLVVDVIIPVHNASKTIEETVHSAMKQSIPQHLQAELESYSLSITVCCYDDGSADESWIILQQLARAHSPRPDQEIDRISSSLKIEKSLDGIGRGAGYARNKAVAMHQSENDDEGLHFLCLLDSDDTMHPHRVAEQVCYMLRMPPEERNRTLLGCQFDRDPPDSTWHYSQWANSLSDDRLALERFREVTILQPTWFLCRTRFFEVGCYVEAPPPGSSEADLSLFFEKEKERGRLVHPSFDTPESLRLAEDLRFFHDHLESNGLLRLHRTDEPLVTYRHIGTSQSYRTSRKLLLQLRAQAFERGVLKSGPFENKFIIWGAGRDGKDFFKALSHDAQHRVYCMVDVDEKKLDVGRYSNRDLGVHIPIIHFSFLVRNPDVFQRLQTQWEARSGDDEEAGRIRKTKPGEVSRAAAKKKQKLTKRSPLTEPALDLKLLKELPVVVCVAMYRTNGVLERNTKAIGRKEGSELWHFS